MRNLQSIVSDEEFDENGLGVSSSTNGNKSEDVAEGLVSRGNFDYMRRERVRATERREKDRANYIS